KAARFPPSARARRMTASVATNAVSSSVSFLFLPPIIFHHKPGHWLDRFLFKDKTLAFIPAPRLFILAHATQRDFIRQVLAAEGQQPAAKTPALIFRRDEQLVEIEFRQMQRQHRRERAAIVGDKQAPALLDLERDACPQFRQQEI